MCLHAFREWTDNLHYHFPQILCLLLHPFSILNLAPTRTFLYGISASTREHHYLFPKQWISSYNVLMRKKVWKSCGVIYFYYCFFFLSGINGIGHWKFCNIPIVIALMLSSEGRGILNQRESDAKHFSTIF